MRKFVRTNYEGTAHGKYRLRSYAKVRTRTFDDYCITCFFNAHSIQKIKGLSKRAAFYKLCMETNKDCSLGDGVAVSGKCEVCHGVMQAGDFKRFAIEVQRWKDQQKQK